MHMTTGSYSILLHTEEPVLALGLRQTLAPYEEFVLRPAVYDAETLFRSLDPAPDLLMLDYQPNSTLELARRILGERPHLKTIFWTRAISSSTTHEAMALRIAGIMRKNLPVAEMVNCLRAVAGGGTWLDTTMTTSYFRAKRIDLSPREGQLITLLAHGMKNREIASELHLSEGTVKVYLSRLFQKTGVRDRFDLALQGVRNLGMDAARPGQRSSNREPAAPMTRERRHLRSLILDEVSVNGS